MNFCILAKPRSCSDFLSRFLYRLPDVNFFRHSKLNYEIIHDHYVSRAEGVSTLQNWFSHGNNRGAKIITINDQFDDSTFKFFQNNREILLIIIDRPICDKIIISYAYAMASNVWHNVNGVELPQIKLSKDILEKSFDNLVQAENNLNMLKELNNIVVLKYSEVYLDKGKKNIVGALGLEWNNSYLDMRPEEKMISDYSRVILNYDECMRYLKREVGI